MTSITTLIYLIDAATNVRTIMSGAAWVTGSAMALAFAIMCFTVDDPAAQAGTKRFISRMWPLLLVAIVGAAAIPSRSAMVGIILAERAEGSFKTSPALDRWLVNYIKGAQS